MKNKTSKEIIYSILKTEISQNGVEANILPLTNLENTYEIIKRALTKYHTNQIELKQLFEDIKKEISLNSTATGIYTGSDNTIKILLENLKKYATTPERYLWALVHTTYHEYRHLTIEQKELKSKNNISYFYILIEQLVGCLSDYYKEAYNDFYSEILANRYASKKTKQYLKNKEPRIYNRLTQYINSFTIDEEIHYQNYDIQLFINKLHQIIKENNYKQKIKKDEYPYFIISELYTNNYFKSVNDIVNNSFFNQLPIESKYLILSSQAYLDEVKYEELTKEELYILIKAIHYTTNLETKKRTINQGLRLKIEILLNELHESNIFYLHYQLVSLPLLFEKEKHNNNKLKYLNEQEDRIIKEIITRITPLKK